MRFLIVCSLVLFCKENPESREKKQLSGQIDLLLDEAIEG